MAKQITFVTADKAEDQVVADVAVFDADGNPVDMSDLGGGGEAYTLPAATASVIGGVKQLAAIADVATDADAAALATAFNGLLAALRTAGIITAS